MVPLELMINQDCYSHPCPCGHLGDPHKECTCTPYQAQRYRNRVSGPILDRIDLQIEVPRLELSELTSEKKTESSQEIRKRVAKAHGIQLERFRNTGVHCNAQMKSHHLKTFCKLKRESRDLLHQVFHNLKMSMRAHDRVLKIARTIADLEESVQIEPVHLAEAVQYRCLDRPFW